MQITVLLLLQMSPQASLGQVGRLGILNDGIIRLWVIYFCTSTSMHTSPMVLEHKGQLVNDLDCETQLATCQTQLYISPV